MTEISRLNCGSDAIELDFVEREATSIEIMELAIHLHLGGLSLSNTVSILDRFGVDRARSTVHNWVQKADLEPRGGRAPAQIALDETVVKVNGERFWLIAAVDPDTNIILHVGLYPSRNTAITKVFCESCRTSMPSMTPNSSSMARPGCMPVCSNSGCISATKHTATATPLNVSFKK